MTQFDFVTEAGEFIGSKNQVIPPLANSILDLDGKKYVVLRPTGLSHGAGFPGADGREPPINSVSYYVKDVPQMRSIRVTR